MELNGNRKINKLEFIAAGLLVCLQSQHQLSYDCGDLEPVLDVRVLEVRVVHDGLEVGVAADVFEVVGDASHNDIVGHHHRALIPDTQKAVSITWLVYQIKS